MYAASALGPCLYISLGYAFLVARCLIMLDPIQKSYNALDK